MNTLNQHPDLAYCTGTEGYTKITDYTKLLISDGALEAVELGKCYWLLDVIASHYHDLIRKNPEETFFTVELVKACYKRDEATFDFELDPSVREDSNAYNFTIEDGNGNVYIKQRIPCSDFDYPRFTLYLVPDVLYLPSEH